MINLKSNKFNKPFGLMFHRLHEEGKKPKGQGSITNIQLKDMIYKIGQENFLSPQEWFELDNKTNKKKICITFDDGLKSQYQVALPILEEFNIKGFWFIYTKTFSSQYDRNEVANYLITNKFGSIEKFLPVFKKHCDFLKFDKVKEKFDSYKKNLQENFTFYSRADIEYRFIRNNMLKSEEFDTIIDKILLEKNVNLENIASELWMNQNEIQSLVKKGHEVGLHSHSHPFQISSLDDKSQFYEYNKNYSILKKITGVNPKSMSHPLNSFNCETFNIMKRLNIKYGFCSKFDDLGSVIKKRNKNLLFSRVDSSSLSKN